MIAVRRWASVALCAVLLSLGSSASAQSRAGATSGAGVARATSGSQSASGAQSANAPTVEGVVNINTATEDELQRLPRVGPSRAAAIVALRSRVQRFRSADDLLRVRGIGRASMRRLRPYVTLNGDTTLLARPGRAPRAQPTLTTP